MKRDSANFCAILSNSCDVLHEHDDKIPVAPRTKRRVGRLLFEASHYGANLPCLPHLIRRQNIPSVSAAHKWHHIMGYNYPARASFAVVERPPPPTPPSCGAHGRVAPVGRDVSQCRRLEDLLHLVCFRKNKRSATVRPIVRSRWKENVFCILFAKRFPGVCDVHRQKIPQGLGITAHFLPVRQTPLWYERASGALWEMIKFHFICLKTVIYLRQIMYLCFFCPCTISLKSRRRHNKSPYSPVNNSEGVQTFVGQVSMWGWMTPWPKAVKKGTSARSLLTPHCTIYRRHYPSFPISCLYHRSVLGIL